MTTATPVAISPEQTLSDALATDRPLRDLADLAVRYKGIAPALARPSPVATPSSRQLGTQDQFWVSDQKAKTYFPITATIVYVSPHAYFYVQDGERVGSDAIRRAADTFENNTYPLIRRYFGSEAPGPDRDARITVLNARIPNVGGYFSSNDQYTRTVSPGSNERNILYVNIAAYPPGTKAYDATLAHEFQHLVSWNVYRAADSWFNEGSSEFAMRLTGYDPGGADNAYANDPDTQLTGWSDDDNKVLAHYGASYLFLVYFAERYGGYDVLRDLFAGAGRGTSGFDNFLAKRGYKERFDDVFRDWVVANYLDEPKLGDGRYGYRDVSIRAKAERISGYPAQRSRTGEQYGARYFELPPAAGEVTIVFTGTASSKLLANDPKSGRWEWWSNRADLMDSTLTRELDLSGVSKATLRFWTWYDLEDGFDYAYVAASSDGGRSWSTLRGSHTTTDDPLGQNLGHGYTGKSGGGAQAEWIEETIDLSAYAGKRILLRFEMVTDDAFNRPGFALDDLSVPELGFSDDAETGNGGWRAEGFVRTSNLIPQPYSVQLIAVGPQTMVAPVPLDAAGRGRLTTKGLGGDDQRLVLAVAPMAPLTSEPAKYEFSVEPVAQ